MRPLVERRELSELRDDTSGELVIEWVLVTTVVVVPMILLVPVMIGMLRAYFYRIADVVSSPFP